MKNSNELNKKPAIKEIIIVEGRDDTAAINRAVEAVTIETHGFGISKKTWNKIESAYKKYDLIVFTDPDHAGVNIRRRILEKYPKCKEAFLPQNKARKIDNIGIENAKPEDIIEALKKAKCTTMEKTMEFTMDDMVKYNLAGTSESKNRREKLGDILGIGYGNSKGLLKKLNGYSISRKDLLLALEKMEER